MDNNNNKKFIQDLYERLDFPGALGGIQRFHDELKTRFPEKNISLNDVKNALREVPLYELHIPRKEKFQRRAIKRPAGAGISFQADIIYLPKHKGYKYGVILVDLYSRYIYMKPLKNKTANATRDALENIIEENNLFKMKQISSDKGKEFLAIQKYFKEKGIGFFFLGGATKAS